MTAAKIPIPEFNVAYDPWNRRYRAVTPEGQILVILADSATEGASPEGVRKALESAWIESVMARWQEQVGEGVRVVEVDALGCSLFVCLPPITDQRIVSLQTAS